MNKIEKNFRAVESFAARGLDLNPQSPNGDEKYLNEAGKRWFARFAESERKRSEAFETFLKQNVRF
jgi:hypothetical protein